MLRSTVFGNYEIVRKLGRGMSDVYLVFDTRTRRSAVLKIIEKSEDEVSRLVLEAERRGAAIQKQLHGFDSRIVEVYEFGDLEDTFFIAMAYVEGKNVAEILAEEKRLDPRCAARHAMEVASQLERLHSFLADIDGEKRAVVHGDIKPSNIQIGANGEVRLLDFGIAKAISLNRTLTHHDFGSPIYCSPERLAKSRVDRHADLWALGVTLHEMVSGTPPYQAEDTKKLESLIQSKAPPRPLPEGCPSALKAILAKALAPELKHRYHTAAAFRHDLRLFLDGRASNANPTVENRGIAVRFVEPVRRLYRAPGRRWRKVMGVAAGLAVGLILLLPLFTFIHAWAATAHFREKLDYTRGSAAHIESDWNLYRDLAHENRFLGPASPVKWAGGPFEASLIAAADRVIEGYRNSSDPSLEHFDWRKAKTALAHAAEIDENNSAIRGKLALCDGYAKIVYGPQAEGARPNFEDAEIYLPQSPDPHLALARVYASALHDVAGAAAELDKAERLGYSLGPREIELEADGYHARARHEYLSGVALNGANREQAIRYFQLAWQDFERARALYEAITGYSEVNLHLRQLYFEQSKWSSGGSHQKLVRTGNHKPKRYWTSRYTPSRRHTGS